MKTLEIIKDNTLHTSYATMNNSGDTVFFEGSKSPLRDAKEWAKKNGYSRLKIISTTLSKNDKVYILEQPTN